MSILVIKPSLPLSFIAQTVPTPPTKTNVEEPAPGMKHMLALDELKAVLQRRMTERVSSEKPRKEISGEVTVGYVYLILIRGLFSPSSRYRGEKVETSPAAVAKTNSVQNDVARYVACLSWVD